MLEDDVLTEGEVSSLPHELLSDLCSSLVPPL